MTKHFLLICSVCFFQFTSATTILVKNAVELAKANKEALPGDIILLQSGTWNNITIDLNCKGTKESPIQFKAQIAGKVIISGKSKLKIGGSHIVVDGLYFLNGYSGAESVITFRNNTAEIANNCRVTNTVINNFNNPKRLDENYWISFYGKNNRLDHCSFLNKKNIGVLLAVILDDERSRENFHLIDNNYFGVRVPLASNAGEIIRVGVSDHCQFSSNTQIIDNFFEHCDGETEIISIKSCKNIVRRNVFKECQGGVVFRHGNFNTVENNFFLGNNKEGTGGVRIINKGQWVVNNFFYKCKGVAFRSPLSIMNGIPNSPANRYLEVSEAVISNNSFYECSPISFCEGSDAERSIQPHHVKFLNNIFYNTEDSILYNAFDDISSISFTGNLVSKTIPQQLVTGFEKTSLTTRRSGMLVLPNAGTNSKSTIPDSLQAISRIRLTTVFSDKQGLSDLIDVQKSIASVSSASGAKWFSFKLDAKKLVRVDCNTADEVVKQLAAGNIARLTINLTGRTYIFKSPLDIQTDVLITTSQKQLIKFSMTDASALHFIQLKAGNTLALKNLNLDLAASTAKAFVSTDTSGSSNHCNFSMDNCHINNCKGVFFKATKSSVSDSILITNCSFRKGEAGIFTFVEETDKRGYYNVEQLKILNCNFEDNKGQLLGMLRSGKDESTMGPDLTFAKNTIKNCTTLKPEALIHLNGIQRSKIENNDFTNCNSNNTLILYEDTVRAEHILGRNIILGSGKIIKDKYVLAKNISSELK